MRLIPRDTQFFDMFVEIANNVAQAATVLRDLFLNFQQVQDSVNRIKELERRGDEMTHKVYVKLNQTFITPFDREDIHTLASSLDDVLDYINAAADRLAGARHGCLPGEQGLVIGRRLLNVQRQPLLISERQRQRWGPGLALKQRVLYIYAPDLEAPSHKRGRKPKTPEE